MGQFQTYSDTKLSHVHTQEHSVFLTPRLRCQSSKNKNKDFIDLSHCTMSDIATLKEAYSTIINVLALQHVLLKLENVKFSIKSYKEQF